MSTEIRVQLQSDTHGVVLRDLIMAWARDEDTGEPRYIMELGPDRRGNRSRCVCPSCLAPVTAVNAAKAEFIKRPHFRHPPGTEKQSCSIVAGRIALLKEVQTEGWIQLPQVRRKATATGLSGQTYEAWVTAPPERVRITDVNFQDHVRALLVLDDGRCLQVLLTGSASMLPSEEINACLTLNIDDPEAASLSPEELRKRLTLMTDWLCWQSHWDDKNLDAEARGLLVQQMLDAIDVPPPDLDLSAVPAELHRETVLHYLAKQILRDAGEIRVPAIRHEVTRRAATGSSFTRTWFQPEATLNLSSIELECRLGRVVPDIVCEAREEHGKVLPRLCIEITVTNPIEDERKSRLQRQGEATLELDLSRTGGRLTKAAFQDMLVREIAFKNWIYHPEAAAALANLQQQVEADIQQHLAETERAQKWRREVLEMDVSDIASHYLTAVTTYLQELDRLDGGMPSASREAIESARVEMLRQADMLAMHGYFVETGPANDKVVRMLARFLSLKHDRGIGYRLSSGFEVLNAIWQSKAQNREEIPMYLAAARLWKIGLSTKQAETVQSWRIEVRASIEAGAATYLRQPTYDRLLALLFPDLEGALAATTRKALLERFVPRTKPLATRHGFLTGNDLERWLRDHPESAPLWEHLRGS